MNKVFDLHQLSSYCEGNRLEAKRATKGLPNSIWETYSSFANTDGGIIVLGVEETKDHKLHASHIHDAEAMIRDFWNTVNNPQKVNLNILTDRMVHAEQVGKNTIVVIEVPRAERELRPVYVGTDPMKGTFRRNHDGDYHCTREQVSAMYRDAAQNSIDTKVLTGMDLSVFDMETVHSYRNLFNGKHPNHVWSALDDELFLRKIGAMGLSSEDNKIHPTIAGLLMFGYEYEIVREFSGYFLDYQERMDPSIRWTHRVVSSSGDWSGNLFDFYYRIISRLCSDLPVPFKLRNLSREEDTPLHKAVREALLNTLVHADYYGRRGTVVIKSPQYLSFATPGDMRISLAMAMDGGFSDPRNATLMKMFGMIGIGERAGCGIPTILETWKEATHQTPSYEISHSPDRVTCVIRLDGAAADSGLRGEEGTERGTEETKRGTDEAPLAGTEGTERGEEGTERGIDVSPKVAQLMVQLGEDTLSLHSIMELMGLSGEDNFRKRYMQPALADDLVTLLYPETPNSKNQKYFLTKKGLTRLAKMQQH